MTAAQRRALDYLRHRRLAADKAGEISAEIDFHHAAAADDLARRIDEASTTKSATTCCASSSPPATRSWRRRPGPRSPCA